MLIVGLGNPGAEYSNTRHNIGFTICDMIALNLGLSWKEIPKFKAIIASGVFNSQKILIIKPTTYMNLSGESISLIKNYYNIDNKDIIVLHDELDIALGEIRYKCGGGSAGHNGIKSLDQHIGNLFHRIRIGIGRPPNRGDVSNFVLGKFTNHEKEILEKLIKHIVDKHSELLKKNFDSIVTKVVST